MKDGEKFHSISEASRLTEIPQHILRYWEKEFSIIRPVRDHRGRRLYTRKDIEAINRIKFLVYNKGYRLRGAKKQLRESPRQKATGREKEFIKMLLRELKEIKKCLK